MESSNPKSRGAVGAEQEDRLSCLPDDVLHSIVGRYPLKDAVRMSALSRRWARLWLHALAASAVLDFTDRGFVRGQSPAQIVATVNRCLRIRGDAHIDALRVALSPFDAFRRDVVGWVLAAVGRGAREVEVDLTQGSVLDAAGGALVLPGELFRGENLLARLVLGRCSLRDVPPDAAGLAGLRSLSLDHVDVTDEAVRDVVSNCRLLEFLSLRRCHLLTLVRIAGERLRGLEIAGCLAVRELVLTVPALESFAFHGDIVYESDFCGGDGGQQLTPGTLWKATPALRDAYLSHVGFGGEYEEHLHAFVYTGLLDFLAHARILSPDNLLRGLAEERTFFELLMDTPNLEELQLLMNSIGDDDVTRIAGFLQLIEPPLLERLFVRLPRAASDPGDAGSVAPVTEEDTDMDLYQDIVLGRLRFIKVVNFRGTSCELRLLEFLLDRAPVLEQLVLVTPEEEGTPGDDEQQQQGGSTLHLKIIEGQVLMMRKASPEASIAVCRPREDGSRNPAHTTYYNEEKCPSGAAPSLNIAPSLGSPDVLLE